MKRAYVAAVGLVLLVSGPAWPQESVWNRRPEGEQAAPRYIVLATDVSSSMNRGDPPIRDAEGRLQVLRDDAQTTFLQLLPFVSSESFVGVAQFTDRIRYGRMGSEPKELGAGEIPKRLEPGEEPLLAWRQTNLDQQVLRDLVRSIEAIRYQPTRVDVALEWARSRIALARSKFGPGSAMVVLLTDGDPDSAVSELSGTRRVVQEAAERAVADAICVHVVLINMASYREGRVPTTLPAADRAAEELMERVAAMTKGTCYRITPGQAMLDIVLDMFNWSPTRSATFGVSEHHRTALLIGRPLQSIQINPAVPGDGARPYTLHLESGQDVDEASGIGYRTIPLTTWNIVILHRPADMQRAQRLWRGRWTLIPQDSKGDHQWRGYLIPDFYLELAGQPAPSWWAQELVRIRARVGERPPELGEPDRDVPPLRGTDLAISMSIVPTEGGAPLPVAPGEWDTAGQTYTSGLLHVADRLARPQTYRVVCDCQDHVGEVDVPLGQFTTEFDVAPGPVTLRLLKQATGETVLELPAGETRPVVHVQGGEAVYGELVAAAPDGTSGLGGQLTLVDFSPATWSFHEDDTGRVVTEAFALPVGARQLAGQAEIQVRTAAGNRALRLPPIQLLYDRPPMRLERFFADQREALWVGELHEQTVSIELSPVFAEDAAVVMAALPLELPEASLVAVDSRSGMSTAIPVRAVRTGPPRQEVRDKVPKVVATYRVWAEKPLSHADQCIIDLGPVAFGLRARRTQYPVVDPVALGLFTWSVGHDTNGTPIPGMAGELQLDQPIRFAAEWRADQEVSAVRFELQRSATDLVRIDLPQVTGVTEARVQRSISDLQLGQTYPLNVVMTLGRGTPGGQMNVRLVAGQFRAVEADLELKEFAVGRLGEDISGYATEPTVIPVRFGLLGYVPGHPGHSARVEEFKRSCRLKVLPANGDVEDIADTLQWVAVQAPPADAGGRGLYRFEGQAKYTPQQTGWTALELQGELKNNRGQATLWSAPGRLRVDKSRMQLDVLVNESKLWSSEEAAAGAPKAPPVRFPFTTPVVVEVRWPGGAAGESLPVRVELARIQQDGGPPVPELKDEKELVAGEVQRFEFSVNGDGDWFVRVSTAPKPGQPLLEALSPPVLSIASTDVVAEVPPSGRLTPLVREWPFKYRVPVQPDWTVQPHELKAFCRLPGGHSFELVPGVVSDSRGRPQWVTLESPPFIAPDPGLISGSLAFSLCDAERELRAWSHPGVQVVAPRVHLTFKDSQSAGRELDAPPLVLTAPAHLEVRPVFLQVPALERFWTPITVTLYVWCDPTNALAEGRTPAEVLRELKKSSATSSPPPGLTVSTVDVEKPGWQRVAAVAAPMRVCGWPRWGSHHTYAIAVSAAYDEEYTPEWTKDEGERSVAKRRIVEWYAAAPVTVAIPWWRAMPLMWWLVGLTLLAIGVVRLLDLWVWPPERLGVDLRLPDDRSATLEPRGRHPLQAEIRATSWCDACRMYIACSRPARLKADVGRLFGAIVHNSYIAAGLTVLFYLWPTLWSVLLPALFWPGRRAWIHVQPKVGNAASERRGAWVCVATSLRSRKTGWWRTSERPWQELPAVNAGCQEVEVCMGFRNDNERRERPVVVRLKIQRKPDMTHRPT